MKYTIMRIGLCANYEQAKIVKECGFDYFEYNLVALYNLEHKEFLEAEKFLSRIDFYAEVMGIMLPPHIKIVGRNADLNYARDYLRIALERAEILGCKMVTFGSSHSRNMPTGFSDRKKAYLQIEKFLEMASEMMEKRGMTLAIEPCPVHENNILTFLSEALYVMENVGKPNTFIMADTYSMQFSHEKIRLLEMYREEIRHLHFSSPERTFPYRDDGHDYSEFFDVLAAMKYDGTLTIEAFHPENFEEGVYKTYELICEQLASRGLYERS